jgi:hypothetical protein
MAKAFRGIFTGYSSSGYRIWNPYKRIFVISNHYTIKEYIKGVLLLNPVSQLYRRLVGTTTESDNDFTDNSDNPDIDYRDIIIIDTGNQQLDNPLENDKENHSNTEGGTTENALRNVIGGASDLSKPPEPLFKNNQEPVVSTGAPEQGSTNQEAPEIVNFRGKLLPRYPKSTRIAGESVDHRTLLVTNQNTEASKIPLSIKEALSGPDTYLWRPSIKKELDSHLRNHTWDLVVRKYQKVIGYR